MPKKFNSFIYPLNKIFQTIILSTLVTHTCLPLLYWTSFGYPLLKLLTGSLISHQPTSPTSCWLCTGILTAPIWSTQLMYGGSMHTEFCNWLSSISYTLLDFMLSSTINFMLTAPLNLLIACLLLSRGLVPHDFLLTHTYSVHPHYARVNQFLYYFFPATGKLWNSTQITQEDLNIAKSMVRLHNIETKEDRTRINMRGVQLEVSGWKKSVEKILERMNTTESTFNKWHMEEKDLKN